LFDPIFENPFSGNCYAFPPVKFDHQQIKTLRFSAVFISHYHDDHFSLQSLDLIDRTTPIYAFFIHDELFRIVSDLGFTNVNRLELDSKIVIGAFEITPLMALDEDVDAIFHINSGGVNVLNVVDAWIHPSTLPKLQKNSQWDMVLWPFQTMREIEVLAPSRVLSSGATGEFPIEWVEYLKALNPKYVVPSSCQFLQESWSWYNHALFPISYAQFEREIAAILPKTRVVRLDPSVSIELSSDMIRSQSSLDWVLRLSQNIVDYDYKPPIKPPTTSEIARHFAALTKEQTNRVYDYCTSELLAKYRSLEPTEDGYFQKARLWHLSVYDHTGCQKHFYYNVGSATIATLAAAPGYLEWSTEVPISKLHAALESGESLTSMYIRINDVVFDPQIEQELERSDIMEDPLIRSLFTGAIGAYQNAQLKKIRSRT
jgi:L-ascorbate metabolism protein UlaG (beta-lactamase superfamily)